MDPTASRKSRSKKSMKRRLSSKISGKKKIDNVVDKGSESVNFASLEVSVEVSVELKESKKSMKRRLSRKFSGKEKTDNVVEKGSESVNFASLEVSVDAIEKWLDENSGSISVEERNEMNEELSYLKFTEMELRTKKLNLMGEQIRAVKEAMQK